MTLTKSMWGAPFALVQLAIAGLVLAAAPVRAAETEWHDGFNSRTRLVSASLDKDGIRQSYAFVEVAMPKGWKTYWRNPGDAGGVPPGFDWSRSENLGSATVLYAAPHRLTDDAGDTIGYKDHVTFPVLVVAKDAKKPVRLALDMTFGICKDICVPSQAAHDLEMAPGDAAVVEGANLAVLESVPRAASDVRPGDPVLKRSALDTSAAKPKLVLEAVFPGGAGGADIFIEAPDGLYVPMPGKVGGSGDTLRFEAELGSGLEPKDLQGKTLTVTLVGPQGQSVVTFKID